MHMHILSLLASAHKVDIPKWWCATRFSIVVVHISSRQGILVMSTSLTGLARTVVVVLGIGVTLTATSVFFAIHDLHRKAILFYAQS